MSEIFYPKQIYKSKLITLENQCFFAMPFSEEFTNLYDTLVLYLQNKGYKCIRVDNNLSASVPIIGLILNGIATSQFVIVDISETNANVFYELGITHTVKDCDNVFIIKEKNANTPFDIQHLQYISYDKNNLKELANELLERLKANEYKSAFKKVLMTKQVLKYEYIDDFIECFSKHFSKKHISIFTNLLEHNTYEPWLSLCVTEAIWEYDNYLKNGICNNEITDYTSAAFKLLFKLLTSCCQISEIELYIEEFLRSNNYGELCGKNLISL